MVTRPSRSRMRSASRTGPRLTLIESASSCSPMRSPGAMSPRRMRSPTRAARSARGWTASARSGRRTGGTRPALSQVANGSPGTSAAFAISTHDRVVLHPRRPRPRRSPHRAAHRRRDRDLHLHRLDDQQTVSPSCNRLAHGRLEAAHGAEISACTRMVSRSWGLGPGDRRSHVDLDAALAEQGAAVDLALTNCCASRWLNTSGCRRWWRATSRTPGASLALHQHRVELVQRGLGRAGRREHAAQPMTWKSAMPSSIIGARPARACASGPARPARAASCWATSAEAGLVGDRVLHLAAGQVGQRLRAGAVVDGGGLQTVCGARRSRQATWAVAMPAPQFSLPGCFLASAISSATVFQGGDSAVTSSDIGLARARRPPRKSPVRNPACRGRRRSWRWWQPCAHQQGVAVGRGAGRQLRRDGAVAAGLVSTTTLA